MLPPWSTVIGLSSEWAHPRRRPGEPGLDGAIFWAKVDCKSGRADLEVKFRPISSSRLVVQGLRGQSGLNHFKIFSFERDV